MMELWDAYKPDGSLAGTDLVRGEPIPQGLCHLVVEILVRHTDGSYLLMQRDHNKQGYPGMFEASAGGSALKGETPEVAARRELKEETGITTDRLTSIYVLTVPERKVIFYGYLCVTDCEKSSITLQEGETIGYRWMPEGAFRDFMETELYIAEHRERLRGFLG